MNTSPPEKILTSKTFNVLTFASPPALILRFVFSASILSPKNKPPAFISMTCFAVDPDVVTIPPVTLLTINLFAMSEEYEKNYIGDVILVQNNTWVLRKQIYIVLAPLKI